MKLLHASHSKPRVAIYSLRNMENHVSRACGYTFEDVIASEIDEVDIIAPDFKSGKKMSHKANVWAARKFGHGVAVSQGNVGLEQDYDLFFFNPAQPRDLVYLNSLKNWRQHSKTAVCWLQELWINEFHSVGRLLDILEQFDHVVCTFFHTAEYLREHISKPVTHLSWGVDTKLFCPYPFEPDRAIDVCAVGEVHPVMHQQLIQHADRTGQYYQYSTVHGVHAMASHKAHRYNYANTLKRSRYFLSFLAKIANTTQRGDQEEFGPRYLEGMASGNVVLGNTVRNPSYKEYFPWNDAVIDVPFDASDISDVIEMLDSDPERTARIRRSNVVNALQRHDHLHRWGKILELAGMEPLEKAARRHSQLVELINLANHGDIRPQPLQKSMMSSK